MQIFGDYHTHTVYSHGTGTIEENVVAAEQAGLKQIAISDHGLSHIAFGVKRRELCEVRDKIDACNKQSKVETLMSIEANITGTDGWMDITQKDMQYFDILLCGYHKFIYPRNAYSALNYIYYNGLYNMFKFQPSDAIVRANTKAYIKMIQRYPVDVITHVNHGLKVNCKQVAQAAYDYGSMIEINGKRISYTDEEFCQMFNTGVTFIANSDAHSPNRVAEISKAVELIDRLQVPKERIANAEGNPPIVFRSRIGK